MFAVGCDMKGSLESLLVIVVWLPWDSGYDVFYLMWRTPRKCRRWPHSVMRPCINSCIDLTFLCMSPWIGKCYFSQVKWKNPCKNLKASLHLEEATSAVCSELFTVIGTDMWISVLVFALGQPFLVGRANNSISFLRSLQRKFCLQY